MTELNYPELTLHPRSLAGVRYPHPSLEDTYQPGVTEGWIAQLVCSLLVAQGGTTVLETGGFMGITSAWLALTLESMGGGDLTVAEIEIERAEAILDRLRALDGAIPNVRYTVPCRSALEVIAEQEDESIDVAWVDDDHSMDHVEAEINALWPKMKSGGLIVGHDIDPPCNLGVLFRKFGGYSLPLPKLGPSGGIGILRVE